MASAPSGCQWVAGQSPKVPFGRHSTPARSRIPRWIEIPDMSKTQVESVRTPTSKEAAHFCQPIGHSVPALTHWGRHFYKRLLTPAGQLAIWSQLSHIGNAGIQRRRPFTAGTPVFPPSKPHSALPTKSGAPIGDDRAPRSARWCLASQIGETSPSISICRIDVDTNIGVWEDAHSLRLTECQATTSREILSVGTTDDSRPVARGYVRRSSMGFDTTLL